MTRGGQARGGNLAAVLGGGVPWAGTEDSLRSLVRAARRRLASSGPRADPPEPDALSARSGRRLEGTRRVAVREGGVAVVPVVGPLLRRSGLLSALFRSTPLDRLARDFTAALESPDVEAVLLDVDSPGGEANGVSELSDMIHAARDSGTRIVAHVGGFAASGALWIASAAEEVVAADAAIVGGVGIVATLETGGGEEPEERRVEIVSSQTPKKRLDPTQEEGRAEVQRVVDDLAGVMLSDLARNRSVPRDAVAERLGAGRLFVGTDAVERDLADRVATFEATVSALAEDRPPPAADGPAEVATESEPRASIESHEEDPVSTPLKRSRSTERGDGEAARLLVAAARSESAEEVELDPLPPLTSGGEEVRPDRKTTAGPAGDEEAEKAAAAIVEASPRRERMRATGDREEEDAADDAAAAIVGASRRRQRKRGE